MNERQIQIQLKSMLHGQCVVIAPNYTPAGWWECDLWAVSRRGYATEYEIKVSAADFRADAKKETVQNVRGTGWISQRKHDVVGTSEHAPSRFYYVVPKELSGLLAEVPEWAGFIVTDGWPRIVKQAPKLHNRKVGTREIRLAQTRMWHRYWEAIGTIERMAKDHAQLIAQARGSTPAGVAAIGGGS